ncbi:hypothetical protein GC176_22945 [bacterium]|nr:hypothetical protein [bacterium]
MLFSPWLSTFCHKTRRYPANVRRLSRRENRFLVPLATEFLETRTLLTGPAFVSVSPNVGEFLQDGDVRNEPPQELLFQFSPGQAIDNATVDAIQIVAAGHDGSFRPASAVTDFGSGGLVTVRLGTKRLGAAENGTTLLITRADNGGTGPTIASNFGTLTLTLDTDAANSGVNSTTVQDLLDLVATNSIADSLLTVEVLDGDAATNISGSPTLFRTLRDAGAADVVTDLGTGTDLRVQIAARASGLNGNDISVQINRQDLSASSPTPQVVVVGNRIEVTLNDNPAAPTTAQAFVSALTGSATANVLVRTTLAVGSGATDISQIPDGTLLKLSGADSAVNAGYLNVGDSANEVIYRFAETLPDDDYRIQIIGTGSSPLLDTDGERFEEGADYFQTFTLNLGSQVRGVVPQPVLREQDLTINSAALLSDGDTITVDTGSLPNSFAVASTDFGTAGADVLFTAVDPGSVSNGITVRTSSFDFGVAGAPIVSVTGRTISVTLNSNSGNESTSQDLVDAINGNLAASALLSATLTGANLDIATSLPGTVTTPLVGGVDLFVFELTDHAVDPADSVRSGNIPVVFDSTINTEGDVADAIAAAIAGQTLTSPDVDAVANTGTVTVTGGAFDVRLTVRAQNAGAMTQRAGGIVQRRNLVNVYLTEDELDATLAEDPRFYRLVDTNGTLADGDDTVLYPQAVHYSPVDHTAVLEFGANLPDATYRLRLGTSDENNDLISNAVDIGTVFGSKDFTRAAYIGNANGDVDVDLYQIDLPAGSVLTVTVSPDAGLDTLPRLFMDDGTPLGVTLTNGGVGTNDTLSFNALAGGTFFVGISNNTNNAYSVVDGTGTTTGGTEGSYQLTISSTAMVSANDDNSSFGTATSLGLLGGGGVSFFSSITPQAIPLPPPAGGPDEPGHREIPAESHGVGPGTDPSVPTSLGTVTFSFPTIYGVDSQGAPLLNQISPAEKDRAREIFEMYGSLYGFEVAEVTSGGIAIVSGDARVLLPPGAAPGSVGGIAGGGLVIINAFGGFTAQDDLFGGSWMGTALHEIGHAIGLLHSYDIRSIQGNGVQGEDYFPGNNDIVHGERLHPNSGTDIDLYQFTVDTTGTLSAEIVAERFDKTAAYGNRPSSLLNSALKLYRQNADGTRTLIAQNDDYFSNDAFINLQLTAGTYFIGVSSTGNTDYDPTVSDSGFNGTSEGDYQLNLTFDTAATSSMLDATGTRFDGNADGVPGGTYEFDFRSANTILVDKSVISNLRTSINSTTVTIPVQDLNVFPSTPGFQIRIDNEVMTVTGINTLNGTFTVAARAGGVSHAAGRAIRPAASDGSEANPFGLISSAVTAASALPGSIIRIVGNGGADNDILTVNDNRPYLLGLNDSFVALEDGSKFEVPKDIVVQFDAGAIIKSQSAVIDAGTSAVLIDRSGGALQVLGTTQQRVYFTTYENDLLGGDSDGVTDGANAGDWGGLVFRADSDFQASDAAANPSAPGIFLNYVNQADISYGGGRVTVDSIESVYAPIHLITSRPTVTYNTIRDSAAAALSADPDSFDDSRDRIGPELTGNTVINNTFNGVFVRIDTAFGKPITKLTRTARFDDTDIVHIITENLQIVGNPGGPLDGNPRPSGRLAIDPGVVVKLGAARIEGERGNSHLIAEGTVNQPVIITSINDDRFGAAGTFDSTGNAQATVANPGDWGGLIFNANSRLSVADALIAYGGGETPIEGGSDNFNVVELHHGVKARIADSTFEFNGAGGGGNRNGRGSTTQTTIFIRQSQPIIVNNVFQNNVASVMDINANALVSTFQRDTGRSTGNLNDYPQFADNHGPLLRLNRFDDNGINGLEVRAETLTTESIWDDTDIVHVVRDEIIVDQHHTYSGLRLQSNPGESLVVKFEGPNAGLTADGIYLDTEDRIGGTVQVIGRPGFPVVLTALKDSTVGAGLTPDGFEQLYTDPTTKPSGQPTTAVVDVVLLLDDTSSFQTAGDTVLTVFPQIVSALQAALPGSDLAFGIARFEEYTGPTATGGSTTVQPFILNQPVISITTPGFQSAINAALARQAPGSGSGRDETHIEALYQIATGVGFDGNGDGDIVDAGPAGLYTTQTNSNTSGDVPDFASFMPDPTGDPNGPVLPPDGTIGGIGFRATATNRIVLLATDGQFNFQDDGLSTYTGVGGVTVPATDFTLNGSTGTPNNAGASIQNTIDALNAQNVKVIGLGSDPFGFTNIQVPLEALATLTGAVDALGNPLYFDVDPNNAGAISSGIVSAVTGAVSSVSVAPGDWRGLKFTEKSNDRNVREVLEDEDANNRGIEINDNPGNAQFLGELAPQHVTGPTASDLTAIDTNVRADGDDNRPLGFEVQGFISLDDPGDVDLYSFKATAGNQIWIDLDRTRGGALDPVVELVQADGTLLARARYDHGMLSVALSGGALPLTEHDYLGGDFYTLNPYDTGFRVILPGSAGSVGTYFVRVRSNQATAGELDDPGLVDQGLTSGEYQLQIRTQQVDEKPGSVVRFADIRYADVGIDAIGLPAHSPLLTESIETTQNNNTLAGAQQLGNLLESDSNVLTTGGTLGATTDVDFYQFSTDYARTILGNSIQVIPGVNSPLPGGSGAGPKTWSTVFDVDYADGLTRGDTTLMVYDSNGVPILIGRESNVQDDRPAAGNSNDLDDLTRGSVGFLDPYIGPVMLPTGTPGTTTTYSYAVSSNSQLNRQLNQTYQSNATNAAVRLEPVNSVTRLIEDHIGFQGYASTGSQVDPAHTDGLFDITSSQSLSTAVRSFDLADIPLFISTGDQLYAYDPLFGQQIQQIDNDLTAGSDSMQDIVMRSDGVLYGYQRVNNTAGTAGRLITINSTTGALATVGTDNIAGESAGVIGQSNLDMDDLTITDEVGAVTFRRNGPNASAGYYEGFYAVFENENGGAGTDGFRNSKLYRFDPATGAISNSTGDTGFGNIQYAGVSYATANITVQDTSNNTTTIQLQARAPGANGNGITVNVSSSGAANSTVTVTTGGRTINITAGTTATAQNIVDMINSSTANNGNSELLVQAARITNNNRTANNTTTPLTSTGMTNGGADGPNGVINGNITGLAFDTFTGGTLYGITNRGELVSISPTSGQAMPVYDFNADPAGFGLGNVDFRGLTLAPQNLYNGLYSTGALSGTMFTINGAGDLVAFRPDGAGSIERVFAFGSDNEAQSLTASATPQNGDTFTLTFDSDIYGQLTTRDIDATNTADLRAALLELRPTDRLGDLINNVPIFTAADLNITGSLAGGDLLIEFQGFYQDKPVNLLSVDNSGMGGGRSVSSAVAIDANGNLQEGGDGIRSQSSVSTGRTGATGLAFSNLDFNLWHTTTRQGAVDVAGHGINPAYDLSRTPIDESRDIVDGQGQTRTQSEQQGGTSFYFGLEQFSTSSSTPYLNYEDTNTQLGILDNEFQRDLTSNANIGNNYNLPGGALGSLLTQPFDLISDTGTESNRDRPTLYFNYFLATQNDSASDPDGSFNDAARVMISTDGGRTWELLATNNTPRDDNSELPYFSSHSDLANNQDTRQEVQELFDNTGVWRQARVDLSDFVGMSGVRLRVDFTTAGTIVESGFTTNDSDLASTVDGFGRLTNTLTNGYTRAANNDAEGFYIDDIIIGWSERGEMITGSTADQNYFTVPQPPMSLMLPQEILTGDYQVEVRRGFEYAGNASSTDPEIVVANTFDPNIRYISGTTGIFSTTTGLQLPQTITDLYSTAVMDDFELGDSDPATFGFDPTVGWIANGTNSNAPWGVLPTQAAGATTTLNGGLGATPLMGTLNVADASIFPSGQFVFFVGDEPMGGQVLFGNTVGFVRQAATAVAHSSGETVSNGTFAAHSGPVGANQTTVMQVTVTTSRFEFDYKLTADSGDLFQVFVDELGSEGGATFQTGTTTSQFVHQVISVEPGTHTIFFVYTKDGSDTLGITDSLEGVTIDNVVFEGLSGVYIRGDRNVERQQGHFQIENNIIRDVSDTAIRVTAAPRSTVGNFAVPGSPINFDQNNAQRLAPGITIANNLITGFENVGIQFGGDANSPGSNTNPASAVPFGKIINNTIFGADSQAYATSNASGIGILIQDYASPTLLNNLIAHTDTAIMNNSAGPAPVVNRTFFHDNNAIGVPGQNSINDPATNPLFVDVGARNFYLTDGAQAVDRSLGSLSDRPTYVSFKAQAGIPNSDTFSPNRDLFGQLRVDDPTQVPSGLGGEVFNDLGAIERADFIGGVARLTVPEDGGLDDLDPLSTVVHIDAPTFFNQIVVQLTDSGIGIDDSTVNLTGSQFTLTQTTKQGTTTLQNFVDYTFVYNANTNEAIFTSLTVFPSSARYHLTVDNSVTSGILDFAANPLVQNQPDGSVGFDILVTDGANDPPVNTLPTMLEIDENVIPFPSSLTFSAANGNAITVDDNDAFLSTNELRITLSASTNSGFADGTFTLPAGFASLVTLDIGTGTNDTTVTFTGVIPNLNAVLNGLVFTPRLNYSGPATINVLTSDLGNFSALPLVEMFDSDDIVLNIIPALLPPAFTLDLLDSAPSGPLSVSEDGTVTDTFTIVLLQQPLPGTEVYFSFTTDDPTEVSVTPSVMFNTSDWNMPKTITVTGVNDDFDDGDIASILTVAVDDLLTTDRRYRDDVHAPSQTVDIVTTDDEEANFTIVAASPLTVSEDGSVTDTFTVVLDAQPLPGTQVILTVTPGDSGETSVDQMTLTFDDMNWNVPQTVTVTGVDDRFDDGDITSQITIAVDTVNTTAPAFLDPNQADAPASVAPQTVDVLTTDDDEADFIIDLLDAAPSGPLTVSEDGTTTTDSFTVVLDAQPIPGTQVVISITPSDATEIQAITSLTFDTNNWNMPQTVTVRGANDFLDEGDILSFVTIAVDTVNTTAPAFIDPNQADAPASVASQTVNVITVDDDEANFTIDLLDAAPSGPLMVSEDGTTTTDTFTVVLDAQPVPGTVVVLTITADNLAEVSVPMSISFDENDWNIPQTVTVTGVDDFFDEGNVASIITVAIDTANTTAPAFLDPNQGAAPASVAPQTIDVVTIDDDVAGFTIDLLDAAPSGPLMVSENGTTTTDTFTVVLDAQPIPGTQVVLTITPNDASEVTSTMSLMFDTNNWNMPQTVNVTGVDDFLDDGDILSTITVAIDTANTDAPAFLNPNQGAAPASVAPQDVNVLTIDDDEAGFTIDLLDAGPSGPLLVSEDGTTTIDTFTVVLDSQPEAGTQVVLTVTANDTTEVSVTSPLTFDENNWNVPQTVTVTGVNDFFDEGDIASTITVAIDLANTTSATYVDPNQTAPPAFVSSQDVDVVTLDDDTAGVSINEFDGVTVAETGTTDTFQITLDAQPLPGTIVVVTFMSGDTGEATVAPASFTFNTNNWLIPRTITVTGVDDLFDDGSIVSQITVAVDDGATTDPAFQDSAKTPDQFVNVTTTDDDTADFTINLLDAVPNGPLTVSESGSVSDSFTVVLTARPVPGTQVVFSITPTDASEVSVTPSLTFDTNNWNVPQTVNVAGLDDFYDDGDLTTAVTVAIDTANTDAPAFLDPEQGAPPAMVASQTVNVTTVDDDTAGFTIDLLDAAPNGPLTVSEDGTQTDSFTVVLKAQPLPGTQVVFNIVPTDATEGQTSTPTLTFDTNNWNMPQTALISGVDDPFVDGNILTNFTVSIASAMTTDPAFNDPTKTPAQNVAFTNVDDEVAEFDIVESGGASLVAESGTSDTFTVVLRDQPLTNVTLSVTSTDTGEVSVDKPILTFTPSNWNMPQTVTVTGVDEPTVDGDQTIPVRVAVIPASSHVLFHMLPPKDVNVTVTDNDVPSFSVTEPIDGSFPVTTVSESRSSDTLAVVLGAQPETDVVFTVSISDPTEATLNTMQLRFTFANWNQPQQIVVTGVDDLIVDGAQISTLTVAVDQAQTNDFFDGLATQMFDVTTLDNDNGRFLVSSPSSSIVSEDGTSQTFQVLLQAQPLTDVVLDVSSSDTTETSVDKPMLTFTSSNWNISQTVTVTGVDDVIVDGTRLSTITVAVNAALSDNGFDSALPTNLAFSTTDNDVAGFTVTESSGTTSVGESGTTDTFTVVLNAQPLSDVVFTVGGSNSDEATVNVSTLTFTPGNWDQPQTVTVTGVDDDTVDGTVMSTVTVAVNDAASAIAFRNLPDATVTVSTIDDDTAGFTITESGGTSVSESGSMDTFDVVLDARPQSDVVLTVVSANSGSVSASPALLTFTPDNWDTPQTVTVTGQDDAVVNGNRTVDVTVSVNVAQSNTAFAGVSAQTVNVMLTDNDVPGFAISAPGGGLEVIETGTTDTFTVVLTAQPLTNVVLDVSSSDVGEASVNPAQLTFTPSNWNVPQTVIVTGEDDPDDDGDQVSQISVAVNVAGSDVLFGAVGQQMVAVTTFDDEGIELTVTLQQATGLAVDTDGMGNVLLALTGDSLADVTATINGVPTTAPFLASEIKQINVFGSGDANTIDLGAVTPADFSFITGVVISVNSGDGNDVITGSSFADFIVGAGGNDVINAGAGNDTIFGGAGKDALNGGDGDDELYGQGSTGDSLTGGEGNDLLDGGLGNDLIIEFVTGDLTLTTTSMTGLGNDTVVSVERASLQGNGSANVIDASSFFTPGLTSVSLYGGGGNDVLYGSAGSDVLSGQGGDDRVFAGNGNDRVFGGSGADTLNGEAGDDQLFGQGGSGDWLNGGSGLDRINGGRGIDRVVASADVDWVLTNSSLDGDGHDTLLAIESAALTGGPSDNVIDVSAFSMSFVIASGGDGNDTLIGGDTLNVLNGGNGADTLIGGPKDDSLRGDAGDDSLLGGDGNDVLEGGDDNDILLGQEGNDTLDGGRGADGLSGAGGNDVLNGWKGSDLVLGGRGDDLLEGFDGNDILIGGVGTDTLLGQVGTDTLVRGDGTASEPGDTVDNLAEVDDFFMLNPIPAWIDEI